MMHSNIPLHQKSSKFEYDCMLVDDLKTLLTSCGLDTRGSPFHLASLLKASDENPLPNVDGLWTEEAVNTKYGRNGHGNETTQ